MSAKPCCADQDCEDISYQKHAVNQASHEKKCLDCSPFFSCGSCVGFIVAKSVLAFSCIHYEQLQQIHFFYKHPDLKDVALSVWQPPRLR